MTWLPILQRELRVRARSRANYWGRFGVGLVGVMMGVPTLTWSDLDPATVGRGAFLGIVGAAFLLSCAACLVTADSISAERREGTLGLLFLTGVRRLDVLVGKLASNSVTCVFALVAFLPVLLIPVLAGGVTGGEAARTGLVLLNTLFVALTAGMWASARGHERFSTTRVAVVLVVGLVLIPILLGWMASPSSLGLASPLGGMRQATDSAYQASPMRYWVSLGLVQMVAWGLLLDSLARLCTEAHADEIVSTVKSAQPVSGTAKSSRDARPLHWLLNRQRGMRAMVWAAAVMSFVPYSFYGLFGLFRVFGGIGSPGLHMGIQWSMHLAIAGISGALLAWVASRFFVEARRTGELELLLTTPVGAETLVSAQWEVLKRLVRWPVVVMVAPILLQAMVLLSQTSVFAGSGTWKYHYLASMLLNAVNTVLGVGALCWLGMWFGLRSTGQARIILWTVGMVRGGPYVLSILFSLLLRPFFVIRGSGSPGALTLLVSLGPQVVALAWYIWLIRMARRQMPREMSGAEPLTWRQMVFRTHARERKGLYLPFLWLR